MESFEYFFALVLLVQLNIIAHSARGKETVYASRRNQFFRNDDIEESVAFAEDLARLLPVLCVFENPRINSFQSPGVEERAPVNELAQRRQRKVVQHAHTRKSGHGQILRAPLDRSAPFSSSLKRDHA